MLRARHARTVFDRPRRTAAAVAVALAAAASGAACGDDEDPRGRIADRRERQARDAAADAGLGPEVQTVLGTAARAVEARFSATFTTAGDERVVVHQLPPRRRVDVVVGGVVREAYVDDGTTSWRCAHPSGGDWSCSRASDDGEAAAALGAFSPELVARTVEALEDGAAAFDLDVHELTVAGTATTCLRATPKAVEAPTTTTESRLCVAADGVPLLLDLGSGAAVLRAVAYRPTADPADVERPDGR